MCSYIIQKSVQPECLNMKATSSADINTPVGAKERSKLICRPKYFFEVMSAQMIYLHSITLISILLFLHLHIIIFYCTVKCSICIVYFSIYIVYFSFVLYIFYLYCRNSICIVQINFVLLSISFQLKTNLYESVSVPL